MAKRILFDFTAQPMEVEFLESGGLFIVGKQQLRDINLIAKCLANTARFNGRFGSYSVAQHCVLMSNCAPKHFKLSALMHDASEAFCGDIIKPVREAFPDISKFIDDLQREIDYLHGTNSFSEVVKEFDTLMANTEIKILDETDKENRKVLSQLFDEWRIWDNQEAETRFIARYTQLTTGSINHG